MEHHRLHVEGLSLHYLRAGTGPLLLLLHGCPQTSHAWRRVMPRLAPFYTVVAPDLPGLGDSARPDSVAGYEKAPVAAVMAAFVHALGHERCFVAGHDIGGTVGYALATAEPALVAGLALLDTGPTFAKTLLDFTKPGGLWHVPFHMAPEVPELLVRGRERAYLRQFFALSYNPRFLTTADLNEYVRCYAAPGGLTAYFNYYRTLPADYAHLDARKGLPITQPTLVLGGDRGLGDFAAQAVAGYATNVEAIVVPHCGHWLPEEQPALVAEHLHGFFERHGRST